MKGAHLCFVLVCLIAACGSPESKPANSSVNLSTNATTNGDTNIIVDDQCVFDADCQDAEACEAQRCVPSCSSDADCAQGEFCAQGLNTEITICQSGPTNAVNGDTNIGDNIEPNAAIQEYYAVRVQSETTNSEACGITDPGPDIYAIGLEDTGAVPLGWGRHIANLVQFGDNDHVDPSHLDGAPPTLDADFCPDQFDGNVVALGCDFESWVAVEFIDGNGNLIPLRGDGSQQIVVYEYGAQCGSTLIDTYRVEVCTDIEAVRAADDSSCTINVLSGGSGIAIRDGGRFLNGVISSTGVGSRLWPAPAPKSRTYPTPGLV